MIRCLLILMCLGLVGCSKDTTPYEHCVDYNWETESCIEGVPRALFFARDEQAVALYLQHKYDLKCEANENCFSVKVLLPLDKYTAQMLPIVVEKTREELKDTPIIIEVQTLEEAVGILNSDIENYTKEKNDKVRQLQELYNPFFGGTTLIRGINETSNN